MPMIDLHLQDYDELFIHYFDQGDTMDESTTRKLSDVLSGIDNTKDMEKFMEEPKVIDSFKNFPDYFRSLSAVQQLESGELIQRSGLERSFYYQVMKGTRNPSRDKVLRLCIAAGLTLRETTRALELSGNAPLYPKNRRDIILTVAINQNATVDDANLLLFKYGEEPLA